MNTTVVLRSRTHHESYPRLKNNNKKNPQKGKHTNLESLKTRNNKYNLLIYICREPDEARESI